MNEQELKLMFFRLIDIGVLMFFIFYCKDYEWAAAWAISCILFRLDKVRGPT